MIPAVTVLAQIPMPGGKDKAPPDFLQGLEDFQNWRFLLELLANLGLAAALGASIAYHPKSRAKATTLEEFEQPSTFIMYAVVGAIVAKVAVVYELMALVVFGIGGLLRFRTDVGPAKDTGRVILVTIIGLACGMNLFPLAVLGTAFGWGLIYALESRAAFRIVIKGLKGQQVTDAAQAYRQTLEEYGCKVLSEKKNFTKGQAAFVFRAPAGAGREDVEEIFQEVPANLQGAVDWEST
jgi:hypothetical protein